MSGLKRKPMPDELTAALRGHAAGLPTATGEAPAPLGRAGEGGRAKAPKTVQVNFSCTEDMARMIAELAAEAGSTRRFIARLLRNAGHTVPQADLQPIDNRRRWTG